MKPTLTLLASLLLAPLAALYAAEIVTPVPGSAEWTRCNLFNDSNAAWTAVAAGSGQPLPLRSLTPPVLLPDGSEFRTWEPFQPVQPRRTFFVAQRHPQASDDNPGSEDRPWKTIGQAAKVLEPGDRVIVKQGLYREWVRPARGGTSPLHMIAYQAAPGEEVIISGSDPLAGRWTPSVLDGQAPVAKAWMAELPTSLFASYNPFAERNISTNMTEGLPSMARNHGWLKPPFTLPQGLIFQDGRRLKQVVLYADLAQADGSYWVEPGGRRLHLRPFADRQPAAAAWEVTTRPFAFSPEQPGLGFVRVAGFTAERVANGFPVPQRGAISANQGHHWIFENNVVREVNGLGMDCGRRRTFLPWEVPADTPKLGGVGHIVRGNTFLECGACSLSGLGLIGGLVEDNESVGCGWHKVRSLLEAGGMKLHYLKHCLVRRNIICGTVECHGLWVDHSIHNTRITQNVVAGADMAAFYLEASYGPTLIDHNVFWGGKGDGILLQHTGNATIAHNLVGRCQGLPVRIDLARPTAKGRMVDHETKRMSSSDHNRLVGNVFYGFESRGPRIPADMDNDSDCNLFINPSSGVPFDLVSWQKKTRFDPHSQAVVATLEFSPCDWTLRGLLPTLECPRLGTITRDFFDIPRSGAATDAGPFLKLNLKPELLLLQK
ncbi:MAG: right-handed parallel beta-helix repeat-containing protein [Verrucomicrobiae bacterium]|nr:right-handed parallel beta-helix repeat-containing protein [Verrucomicrobiae bacterium]